MALMDINVSPLGTGSTSVGEFVVNMQRLLAEQGLPYELTDMGTIIEGNIDQLLAVAKALHENTFSHRPCACAFYLRRGFDEAISSSFYDICLYCTPGNRNLVRRDTCSLEQSHYRMP